MKRSAFDPQALSAYLQSVIRPLIGDASLRIEHRPNCPADGDHYWFIHVPRNLCGLLIGRNGDTAKGIRALMRSFALQRQWTERVDARVVRPD